MQEVLHSPGTWYNSILMNRTWSRTVRIMAVLSAQVIAGFFLVCMLVIIQSQHHETYRAEAIMLLCINHPGSSHAHACDRPPLIEHTIDLYRQGYANRIFIAGQDDQHLSQVRQSLIEKGIPETVVQVVRSGTNRHIAMVHAVMLLYQHGITSVVLVDESGAMLENLKMARDLGMIAHASPPPGPPPDIGQVIRAAWSYWGYVLGQNQLDWHTR